LTKALTCHAGYASRFEAVKKTVTAAIPGIQVLGNVVNYLPDGKNRTGSFEIVVHHATKGTT
jgi:hypothetical protein